MTWNGSELGLHIDYYDSTITAKPSGNGSRLDGEWVKKAAGGGQSMSSQPMGSLFEQSLFLLLDALIVMLMEKRDVNADEMFDRHANLE